MVAGFRYQKDQDTLIKAFARLSQESFELWLVGDGERRLALEELVERFQLEENVKFLGIRANVPEILKASDVVVMSSHFEGMSLSNIEGMSAGKPFVASNVDGLREVTQDVGIMFEHENDEELAQIIIALHDNKDYYNKISERCFEKAQNYDIHKMLKQYIKVYEEMVK